MVLLLPFWVLVTGLVSITRRVDYASSDEADCFTTKGWRINHLASASYSIDTRTENVLGLFSRLCVAISFRMRNDSGMLD
jgi:hypothetical protein